MGRRGAMPKRVKVVGTRGGWTAAVEGKDLAVLHDSWRRGATEHFDPMPGVKRDGRKYRMLLEALSAHDLAVLRRDADDGKLSRDGYIGIFRFADLDIGSDGSIALRLTERYAEPRPN